MPVISSKVSQQELEAIGEYANREGVTISNLIRTVLLRQLNLERENIAATQETKEVNDQKPLLERLAESRRNKQPTAKRTLQDIFGDKRTT